jgi:hypothetical protein
MPIIGAKLPFDDVRSVSAFSHASELERKAKKEL